MASDPSGLVSSNDKTAAIDSECDPPPEKKTKRNRSANWVEAEDEQLAISWVRVSENTISSNNCHGNNFFGKVTDDFNKYSKLRQRDIESVKIRWAAINTATLRFSAIYNSITRNPPSGTNGEVDWLKLARAAYLKEKGSPFAKLHDAWTVLRGHPKWLHNGVPSTPVKDHSQFVPNSILFPPSGLLNFSDNLSSDAGGSIQPEKPLNNKIDLNRPIGQKKAKRLRVEDNEKVEMDQEKINTMNKSNILEEKRIKVMEEANQLTRQLVNAERQSAEAKSQNSDLNILKTREEDFPDDEFSINALRLLKRKVHTRLLAESTPKN